MRINWRQKYIKLVIGVAIILPLIFTLQATTGTERAEAVGQHKASETVLENAKKAEGKVSGKNLTHEQIVSLTGGFMDTLVQEIDNQNRVKNFNTKSELLNAFKSITTKEVASKYVDFYFIERANGLFIKPTETPPWFNAANSYEKVEESKNTVTVKQHNVTDLYGSYTINFEFTRTGKQWKITDIAY
ncbi:hypothetical protein ACFO3D_10310 [Virgibacillus kekensis]|uniref:DUF3993 domain-containing protein n=1 Tax=Virgibacillus kekensis TaxID=202261 RepID=A0ABV9DKS0_9BACI